VSRADQPRQSARKGLRLWLRYSGTKTVMMPGWWTHRKAREDARMLAAGGLTVQIRRGRELLREVSPTTTAAVSRPAKLRLAA
jgi:hypothetical protein